MPRHNPYDNPKLQKLLKKLQKVERGKLVNTWHRELPIVPEMIGHNIGIHNGRAFILKEITPQMVSEKRKLGEYSETRKFRGHGKSKGRH